MEKSREHFMVTCIYEELDTPAKMKYSEKEDKFIRDLLARFFNDPDYKLSDKQLAWLDAIWLR